MTGEARDGGCLCGAVRYRAEGRLRPIVICHCGQCLRTHGGPAPYSAVRTDQLRLVEETGLAWYESSPGVRRGFCNRCGSSLFWRRDCGEAISLAAGSLDDASDLTVAGHIYVADAPSWDARCDGLAAFDGSDDGSLTNLQV